MADRTQALVRAALSEAAMSYPDFPAGSPAAILAAWPSMQAADQDAVSAACRRLEAAWDGDDAAEAYRAATALGTLVHSTLQKY